MTLAIDESTGPDKHKNHVIAVISFTIKTWHPYLKKLKNKMKMESDKTELNKLEKLWHS